MNLFEVINWQDHYSSSEREKMQALSKRSSAKIYAVEEKIKNILNLLIEA